MLYLFSFTVHVMKTVQEHAFAHLVNALLLLQLFARGNLKIVGAV